MISAKIAFALVLGAFGLGMIPSCASTTDVSGGTDSNTHWLEQCQADKDCGSSLVCRCGACTKPCAEPTDCTPLGVHASCAAEACDTGAKVCVASCGTPSDCPHGGSGFDCTGGRCVATPANAAVCPDSVAPNGPCSPSGMSCTTKCAGGNQSHWSCEGGHWVGGLGLNPCGQDAGDPGTGETCAPGTASGGACSNGAQCWRPCSGGSRGQFVCSDGQWLAGHGLFPCGSDAGSPVGTGGSCPARVKSGVPCGAGDEQCWTPCTNDLRGQFVCSGGQWLAGKGLFPCGTVDSGPPVALDAGKDPCAPMDAHTGGLPCASTTSYAWNGKECAGVATCSCEGKDCGAIYPTAAACRAAWTQCLAKLPTSTACQNSSECEAMDRACCVCGEPQITDKIALNANSGPAWTQTHGCVALCVPCSRPPGTIEALCQSGACTAVNLLQDKGCLRDEDCMVRTKDCCQCGGPVTDPDNMIAVNASFSQAYSDLVCTPNVFHCEACQAPTFPANVHARCNLSGGYCYLSGI